MTCVHSLTITINITSAMTMTYIILLLFSDMWLWAVVNGTDNHLEIQRSVD